MNLESLLQANPNPVIVEITKDVKDVPGVERGFQFSASQIETWRDCPRKWAFRKIDRVEQVKGESAKLGSEVHLLREKWLRDGVMPDGKDYASLVARAGIEQLPMPGMSVIEGEVVRLAPALSKDAFWIGYVDFSIADQGLVGYSPPEDKSWPSVQGIPLVGDHKTTGKKDFIKTPDQLVHIDPQGAMYAWDSMEKHNVDEVDLFWAYMIKHKKRPKGVPVRVRAKRTDIEASYLRVLDDAAAMKKVKETPGIRARDVEPNPKACDSYGGCPHRESGLCQLTMTQKIGALKMSNGDLEAKLMAQLGEAPAPAAAPPPNGNTNTLGAGLASLQAAMSNGVVVDMPAQAPAAAAPVAPAPQGGGLAAMLGGTAPPAAPAPTQTVAEAAKTLSEAQKVAQVSAKPPAVVPPDAPAADLNAEPPAPKEKKMTAAMKKRREAVATHMMGSMYPTFVAKYVDDPAALNKFLVNNAVHLADLLIAKLDA